MSCNPKEAKVVYATVRESWSEPDHPCWDIECRFSDEQKFAAIMVDHNFEGLADLICGVINLPPPQLELIKLWIQDQKDKDGRDYAEDSE